MLKFVKRKHIFLDCPRSYLIYKICNIPYKTSLHLKKKLIYCHNHSDIKWPCIQYTYSICVCYLMVRIRAQSGTGCRACHSQFSLGVLEGLSGWIRRPGRAQSRRTSCFTQRRPPGTWSLSHRGPDGFSLQAHHTLHYYKHIQILYIVDHLHINMYKGWVVMMVIFDQC